MAILYARHLLTGLLASWPEDGHPINAILLGCKEVQQIPCVLDLLYKTDSHDCFEKVSPQIVAIWGWEGVEWCLKISFKIDRWGGFKLRVSCEGGFLVQLGIWFSSGIFGVDVESRLENIRSEKNSCVCRLFICLWGWRIWWRGIGITHEDFKKWVYVCVCMCVCLCVCVCVCGLGVFFQGGEGCLLFALFKLMIYREHFSCMGSN